MPATSLFDRDMAKVAGGPPAWHSQRNAISVTERRKAPAGDRLAIRTLFEMELARAVFEAPRIH